MNNLRFLFVLQGQCNLYLLIITIIIIIIYGGARPKAMHIEERGVGLKIKAAPTCKHPTGEVLPPGGKF